LDEERVLSRAIHQLVAGYSNGDAISNEARTLRTWFRAWGFRSEIYCEASRILPELRKDARDVSLFPAETGPDDVVMLHLSIGSDVNDLFPRTPAKKVVRYHNVTPDRFFRAVDDHLAHLLARGRAQMKELAGVADLNLADSGYNAEELREAGYGEAHVLPLALELRRLEAAADPEVLAKYQDGKLNVLFVGRCVPNKRLEDLLYAHYYLQNYHRPDARLLHVGSFAGTEPYLAMLQSVKRDLKLNHVDFVGSVPESHLCAYYQLADVFLCMSEHEGFGIPLLEAMQARLPVLAFDSAAVAETMDGAGLLFRDKIFDEIAAWTVRLAEPGPLRDQVIAQQNKRLQRYEDQQVEAKLKGLLAPLLEESTLAG
jgi:glycosyltransferase involved in cell wall biosynthesis